MKKLLLVVSLSLIFTAGFVFANPNQAGAAIEPGCEAGASFNIITGEPCVSGSVPGCISGSNFSSTTGESCTPFRAGTTPYITFVNSPVNVGMALTVTGVNLRFAPAVIAEINGNSFYPCIHYTSCVVAFDGGFFSFVLPPNIAEGLHSLRLIDPVNGSTNTVVFKVVSGTGNTSTPRITSLSSLSGAVGGQVTIYGSGFTAIGNSINVGGGIVQNVSSPNGNSLSFLIPNVSLGIRAVLVSNLGGASNIINLMVTNSNTTGAPIISAPFPSVGPVGSPMIISGSGFSAAGNSVLFFPVLTDAGCSPEWIPNLNLINGEIRFTVPFQYFCGLDIHYVRPGNYIVQALNANYKISNAVNFVVNNSTSSHPNVSYDSSNAVLVESPPASFFGRFSVDIKIHAGNGGIWIPLSPRRNSGDGAIFTIRDSSYSIVNDGNLLGSTLERIFGGTINGNFLHLVNGEFAELRLTVNYQPTHAGYFRMRFESLAYSNVGPIPSNNQVVLVYQTPSVLIPTPFFAPGPFTMPTDKDFNEKNTIIQKTQTTSILQAITNLISANANYMVGSVQAALINLFDQLQAVNGR